MLRQKEKGILHFIGGVYVDGYLWTSALEWNGYYRVDIETGRAEFLGLFEYADVLADKMFYQVLAYGKYIFFIPWFSNYLVRLDTETLDTKYWIVPECIVAGIAKFRTANLYDGQIFMFPHVGDYICIFHIEEERFECDKKWVREYATFETRRSGFGQGCRKDQVVYLSNYGGSFMVKYDMERRECEMILFPKEEEKIIDITEYGKDELLILTWPGNIWKYDTHNMQKKLIFQYGGINDSPYSHIFLMEDILYLIPTDEENIRGLKGEKWKEIIYPAGWKQQYKYVGFDNVFVGYLADEKHFLLYPCKGNMLLEMKAGQKRLSGVEICEDSIIREKAIEKYLEANGVSEIKTELKVDLGVFLNIFVGKVRGKDRDIFETDGMRIWRQMKDE